MKFIRNLLQNIDEDNRKLFFRFFYISLIFHTLAVIFSEGYHRPDEHLVIIRMMGYKLGTFSFDELCPINVGRLMRPWLHPGIFFLIVKFLNIFSIKDPFVIMTIVRGLSSILGMFSFIIMALWSFKYIDNKKWQKYIAVLYFLIWWIPFFHARSTSENYAVICFILGFVLIFLHIPKEIYSHNSLKLPKKVARWELLYSYALISGIFFGFAYLFRLMWNLIYARMKIKLWMITSFGVIIPIIWGVFIDFWGYSKWTFTSWNYFYQSLFNGTTAATGVGPFYDYFREIFFTGVPPISILFLIPPFWFLIKHPSDRQKLQDNPNCQLEFSVYPKWLLNIKLGGWQKRSKVLMLFRCSGSGRGMNE